MNFYSYSHHGGMQYHATKAEAQAAADKSIRTFLHNGITDPDVLGHITWGEVTERAADTGAGYTLKRQERLTYEAAHPQVIDGRMPDADGNLVLLRNIHESDLLEHDLVLSIACIWENLNGKLGRFKQYCFEDTTTYVDLLFERFKTKRGGTEGNMTFTTVDRRWKLNIAIQKAIDFGPEIEVAKAKMLAAVREMAPDSDMETIVTAAFTQIDGRLNIAAILRLRKLKIENATWNEGMEIVNAAIEVIGKKKQIRLYRRDGQGQYEPVPLNIAAL